MIKRIPILFFILAIIYIYFKDETFTDKNITIGTSIPKTGIIKAWGDSVTAGANSYFKYANDENLLGDKKINFLIYDDKYEPELTVDNAKKLTFEDNAFALFGLVGTPTVKSILPILYDKDIPLFATFSGASFLRNTKNENFINFRSSYQEEIEAIVSHLHDEKGLSRIAVFYQNDDYGEEGYISLINSLKKRGLPLVAEGSYKRNTLSINHAFNEIKDASPEAIVMVGAYKTNSLFIEKAKENIKMKNTIFCNISFGDANEMVKELKKQKTNTKNLLFSQVVPSYFDTNIPVILEYQTLMKKYYPNQELGFISLEAFLSAKVLVNAIKRIKGDITRQKFLHNLKTTPYNLLDGVILNFRNTQLLNKVYLFEYKNSTFEEMKN
ncbi:ABC transporter substrate-binding protein [Poseidonibacter ostreae]|jgi:branched-chain amino acid transport system substrate-binding protein|uniref:ABC transporter substrate-binding protein n=1 Tax=Poseidonibacter ostreae TaxID=2654171 RepID=A0A6L4WR41_9BACT|nr:ABC transporter substrate-binding protein [Poseidonibacter ostreae]KAB7887793.1 ABC transporter substrate-binding protein [Poseidonibacter ostreae]KAB7888252.1 ABC transporter substrate-binding protein [Poseidonibacter ostreae]KAB7890944.1 ABC transporter substrate-binding protein [Poseidonibacter ostreae]MAC84651.1 amino acid-binding protein [Arcobacter sp.]|tara:strand:+ start:677 stop:1825 length:1149 start_codon:yes stop_codon:yes gene_type:complete